MKHSKENVTLYIHFTLDKSYKHNVELKKPDTTEYILYDSIYIKFRSRKNSSTMVKVRIVIILVGKSRRHR